MINKILLPLVLVIGALLSVSTFANNESDEMVSNIANFRFNQLGHPQIQSDSIKPVLASVDRPHKLLIIPVRFPELGYDRFSGEADQDDRF